MVATASTTNPTSNNAIEQMAAFSKEVKRMLGLSLHGWENTMVVFLIIAGFFALIAGTATWIVVLLQRQEAIAANERIEALRAANLALEAQISPRDLNVEQRKAVSEALKDFSGRTVTVQSFTMDSEAMRLGYEIMLALDGAGIQFFDNRGSVMIAGPALRFGIEISNPGTEDGQKFGISIAGAIMRATEGNISVRHLAVAHTSDVIVFVGAKPIPGIR
jgi:cell division protein FtsB